MRTGTISRSAAWLLVTVSAFGVSAAHSQQSDAGANSASSEIIVTASRREQRLQDVPMSVNVATGEQLERLKILDVKDVQQLAPGLELTNTFGRNNVATLRGVTFDPDQGTSPAVDVYVNEVPVDAQAAFTAIYDIDQIEVLRGPQGALRGRTSPAGAITIRTRRPNLTEVEGYAQATATDDKAFNFQGGVSLPLVQDKVALRAAMLVDGNQLNQVRNVALDRTSRSRTLSGRVTLALQPAENFDINIIYQYLNADNYQYAQIFGPGNAAIGNPPIGLKDRLAVAEGFNRFQNSSHYLTLDAKYDFGAVTLAVIGGHQYSNLVQGYDQDPGDAVHHLVSKQLVRSPFKVDVWEARLLSNNDGFLNWTIGAYYSKEGGVTTVDTPLDFIGGFAGSPVPDTIVPITGYLRIPVDNRTMAIAGSVRLAVTDKLTVEAAARYSDIRNNQVAVLTIPDFGDISLVDKVTKAHPLTGSATVTYEVNPDLTVYAAYGRSFRAGTAGVGVPQNLSTDLNITDSESSDSLEAGLKTSFLNRRLSVDVAAFYQKFNGFISRFTNISIDQGTNIDVDGDGIPDGVFVGAPDGDVDGATDVNYNGDATIKGVELTISGRPTDNWDFSISSSYVKARYKNALLPCNTFDGAGNPIVVPNAAFGGVNNASFCNRNSRLADVPNFSLTANTEIRFPFGNVQPFIRGILNYRPSVFSENAQFRYPHRENINLFAGVRGPDNRWEVSIFARNLLNQEKITNIVVNNSTVTGVDFLGGPNIRYDSGYRGVNLTNPREVGLSAQIKF